jgi:integrase
MWSLNNVIAEHNGVKNDGTTASFGTQAKRAETLRNGFKELDALGYKLPVAQSFKGKHFEVLTNFWLERGLAPSTVLDKMSVFRTFCYWIGKAGMVEASEKYLPDGFGRSEIAKFDHSWSAKNIDIPEKIAEIALRDERVSVALELQAAFGMRVKESILLRPHLDDKGVYLQLAHGTKTGRPRVLTIDSQEKRAALEHAKNLVDNKRSCLVPNQQKYVQFRNHYNYEVKVAGLSKALLGVTSHGLRHAFANDLYEKKSGHLSPVRGGPNARTEASRTARQEIAEELGHGRASVTSAYIGK